MATINKTTDSKTQRNDLFNHRILKFRKKKILLIEISHLLAAQLDIKSTLSKI
jgi:hypothetical protein